MPTPTDNPYIERYWRKLRREFWTTMLERLNAQWERKYSPDKEERKKPIVTMFYSELRKILFDCVHEYNTNVVHGALGMTPAQAWARGAAKFVPKEGKETIDECFRMRDTASMDRLGGFIIEGNTYYCRGLSRKRKGKIVYTYLPGGNRDVVRVYLNGIYRGPGRHVVPGSRRDKWMRLASQRDSDKSQDEGNRAGNFARKEMLHEGDYPSKVQRDPNPDAFERRKELNEEFAKKDAVTAACDARREYEADQLSIMRPWPAEVKKVTPSTRKATSPKAPKPTPEAASTEVKKPVLRKYSK